MARVRQVSVRHLHDRFGDAALAWMPTDVPHALDRYATKHGVAHLLCNDRKDDAEQRMLDLHFMAAFAEELAAEGYRAARFEFPYMLKRRETGRRRPPDDDDARHDERRHGQEEEVNHRSEYLCVCTARGSGLV